MVKEHLFFRGMDWDHLLHQRIRPLFELDNQDHLESRENPESTDTACCKDSIRAARGIQRILNEHQISRRNGWGGWRASPYPYKKSIHIK
ncbi:hypothetical protein XENTR_v10011115 [Xenopus tropicalis]|nr:hypothetical protein XENTR_v10011115 [Xenopus tropicalis]